MQGYRAGSSRTVPMTMFGIMKRLTVSLSKLVSVDTCVCGGELNLGKGLDVVYKIREIDPSAFWNV